MKRLALLLLVLCLLLSGCSITPSSKPKEQTIEEVGVTLTVKGIARLLQDTEEGDFGISTHIGTFFFSHGTDMSPNTITYDYICNRWYGYEDYYHIYTLDNGAYVVRILNLSPGVTEFYYYLQQDTDVWSIHVIQPTDICEESETLAVLQSIRFSE